VLRFAALCVVVAGGVFAYFVSARDPATPREATVPVPVAPDATQIAPLSRQPHLLFRNNAQGEAYGRLAVVPLDAPDGERHVTALSCDRVYGMGEAGLCLQATRGAITTYGCVSFDGSFQVKHTFKLNGIPSRTRVSRDGRFGAVTVFTAGHSYSQGGFSTETTIFDLHASTLVSDLEKFEVRKNNQPFKAADFNFWGITFSAQSDRFYATLATAGKIYLVEGRISTRTMTVLREGVECPSLSPDETRIVFKSRVIGAGGRLSWRVRILDLSTQADHFVNELRSVDDQSEWLDNDHVLYTLPRGINGDGSSDIWLARADGTGDPRIFVRDATSPCVVRP
jgi:hypothetical protein